MNNYHDCLYDHISVIITLLVGPFIVSCQEQKFEKCFFCETEHETTHWLMCYNQHTANSAH